MKKIVSFVLVILSLSAMLVSCKGHTVTNKAEITIEGYGTIKAELYGKDAPITVMNFVELAKSGYYDGTQIVRVQDGFVIQTGRGKGTSTIRGEFLINGTNNPISHERGVLSMARSTAYNSASDQFFICLDDELAKTLDGYYASFGKVVEGLDIVDKIAADIKEAGDDAFLPDQAEAGFLADAYKITITSIKITK